MVGKTYVSGWLLTAALPCATPTFMNQLPIVVGHGWEDVCLGDIVNGSFASRRSNRPCSIADQNFFPVTWVERCVLRGSAKSSFCLAQLQSSMINCLPFWSLCLRDVGGETFAPGKPSAAGHDSCALCSSTLYRFQIWSFVSVACALTLRHIAVKIFLCAA